MVAYTEYSLDARVRREAETLVAENGFDVTVFALKENMIARHYDLDGVTVRELNVRKYHGSSTFRYILSYLRFTTAAFFYCTSMFFHRRIDVVHVHNMPNFLVLTALVPRIFGKKLILDMHDSVPETFAAKFNSLSRILFELLCIEEALCCTLSHHIVCVNHIQKNIIQKRRVNQDKIVISMNLPDPRRFRRSNTEPVQVHKSNAFKIAYHGTIAQRLGIDLAIQAISIIKDKAPGVEFHIWGGGEFLNDCIALAEKLDISHKIHFNGIAPLETLSSKLRNVDLGIVPNRKNSATDLMLPVKLLEYIWLGIPVVVPSLDCVKYYFSEKMVTYCKPDDPYSLAEAILKLYNDPVLRKAQTQEADLFMEKYNWAQHKSSLLSIYRDSA